MKLPFFSPKVGILILWWTFWVSFLPQSMEKTSIPEETLVHLFEKGETGYRTDSYRLIRHQSGEGERADFSMLVDSVICKEESCEVVTVKLTWDTFGRYKSFQVQDGKTLTKLDHKDFTEGDYERLHEILSNKTSALAEVDRESLLNKAPVKKANSQVDGMSGATTMFLRNDVIAGAAYTCFHLWDLANKRVPPFIQNVSKKVTTPDSLRSFLGSKDEVENILALQAFEERGIKGDKIELLIDEMIKRGGHDVIPALMRYLEASNDDLLVYEKRVVSIFKKANSKQKTAMLDWLMEKSSKVNRDLLLGLCQHMSDFESYREVQLLLRLCEEHQLDEEKMIPYVLGLLSHDKFFVQRRAYQFLEEQKLSPEDEAVLQKFYKNHEDRL